MPKKQQQSMARSTQQYKLIGDKNQREIKAIPLVRTHKKSLRKIYKCSDRGEFPDSLIRFGPVYHAGDSSESAKEEAWKQVLRKSSSEGEGKEQITKDFYMSAIRIWEKKARAAYAGEALDRFTESQFRWMMIKDGCFFLQLTLFILGVSNYELGYSNQHIIFGKNQEKKVLYGWIKSMFYVGNQIPLLVLNELMRQDFFQKVINDHKNWERPTDMLSKGVLYDLLILPAKAYAASQANGSTYLSEEQPFDLLHGLQNLLLGPRVSRKGTNEEEDEEDDEEGHDLEAGAKMDVVEVVVDNDDKERSVSSFKVKGVHLGKSIGAGTRRAQLDNLDGVDNDSKERCVSGFRKKGIRFWKSNGAGIRGIRFKNRMLCPVLYLPTIPLNRDTKMLFENLSYYEVCQQQKEVRSYLALMNQLISTYEDVNHLASKKIFAVSKPQYKEKFLRMLKKLYLPETTTNHDHQDVLQQLRDYSSFPWEYFKYVAIIAFILSVLQTVFGVLSYVVGVKQLHQPKS